jgi:hypothetical protein
VGLAARAIGGLEGTGSTSAPAPARPWLVVDRLGEETIRKLIADRSAGMTQRSLARRYDVSLSSVKRSLASKNAEYFKFVQATSDARCFRAECGRGAVKATLGVGFRVRGALTGKSNGLILREVR